MKDITDQVDFGFSDDEYLPLTKCACGALFDMWEFTLHLDQDSPTKCPKCGRKMFFCVSVRVYEVEKPE